MFYVNDQYLDLNTVKLNDPNPQRQWYSGPDEIKTLLATAWKELEERFFEKGENVVFKTPSIRSGNGKGNQGYAYPRVVIYKGKKGQIKVAWCDSVENKNGKMTYTPVLKRIGVNEKTLMLKESDIEEALWMFLFNPNVVGPKHPIGRTFLEDKEAEAQKYADTETNAAVISYWLFREESPFFSDDAKLATLCLVNGINPEGKSITYRKQLIAEAVKKAEKRGDIEFNLKAFNSMCEKLKDGQDTNSIETLALMQQCINKRVIRYDTDLFKWVLLGTDGKTVLKTVCKVPPQQTGMAKTILRNHLISTPDDFYMLQATVNEEPVPGKNDRVMLSVALPGPDMIDEAFLKNELSWADRKACWKFFGGDLHGVTDAMIIPLLLEKLVLNKIEIPFEVKRK